MAMSKPSWIGSLLGEAASLLRESETVEWLTTDVADSLATRAASQKSRIEIVSQLKELKPGQETTDFEAITRLARVEAETQQKIAGWLQGYSKDARRLGADA